MKKIFGLFCILGLFFGLCACVFADEKKAPKPVTKIEIETRDHFILVGDLYFAKEKKPPKPLVLLLHSYGSRALEWYELPRELRVDNFNVLALDLRGHGRSVRNSDFKYKSKNTFTNEDWARLPFDIIDSIDYVAKNYPRINTDEIYIVGADIGANAAILAARAMRIKPKKMVLISPYSEIKGMNIVSVLPHLKDIPMMVMASRASSYSYAQADIISRLISAPMQFRVYSEGGSGLLLLKRNPISYQEILQYIISGK